MTVAWVVSSISWTFVLTTSYGADEREISTAQANQLCDAYMFAGAQGVSVIFSSASVGATKGEEETGASLSGGGFSNIFARPSYQADTVEGYLSTCYDSINSLVQTFTSKPFRSLKPLGKKYILKQLGSSTVSN
ncbi:hypothetical protein BDP27DRAFT_1426396 [Rhodocollybia butyracea]|uniref:Uncharacterized protein n=1 Tax=Rhodocollybia butyracea TaxID=206335 RepID=A0A9P5PKW7_9AGAR|nr:hypothetical protein BDP27DRAFT_1426396 [Rhodocollybia butyracea]